MRREVTQTSTLHKTAFELRLTPSTVRGLYHMHQEISSINSSKEFSKIFVIPIPLILRLMQR